MKDCEKTHYAHGWCEMHYARWRRNGSPDDTDLSQGPRAKESGCSVEGCGRLARTLDLCGMHRRRLRVHGSPEEFGGNEVFRSPEEALRKRSKRDGECIVWTGWIDPDGYGQMRVGGKTSRPHRVAWELKRGPIPQGAHLDHTCYNPSCLNLDHLRIATPSQNGANRSGLSVSNTSGYRGVSWSKQKRKWKAEVQRQGHRWCKMFPEGELEAAAEWAERKRQEVFGPFSGRSK